MGKIEDDDNYKRGVEAGKEGFFLTDFTRSLGRGFPASRSEEIFNKGYDFGVEYRYGPEGRYHTYDGKVVNDPKIKEIKEPKEIIIEDPKIKNLEKQINQTDNSWSDIDGRKTQKTCFSLREFILLAGISLIVGYPVKSYLDHKYWGKIYHQAVRVADENKNGIVEVSELWMVWEEIFFWSSWGWRGGIDFFNYWTNRAILKYNEKIKILIIFPNLQKLL